MLGWGGRRNVKWTTEQLERLRTLYDAGERIGAITAELNREFGTSYTTPSVRSQAINSLGLRRETRKPAEWTDEATAQLRELVASRKPHRAIAAVMGITRSAVFRQITKLGLNDQLADNRQEELVKTMASSALRRESRLYKEREAEPLKWVPREYREDAPLPLFCAVVDDPLNLSMAEVRHGQCRYIMNDDLSDPKFCGHARVRKSWCARHLEVVMA